MRFISKTWGKLMWWIAVIGFSITCLIALFSGVPVSVIPVFLFGLIALMAIEAFIIQFAQHDELQKINDKLEKLASNLETAEDK